MGDKNSCLSRPIGSQHVFEDGITNMGIQCRQRVLQRNSSVRIYFFEVRWVNIKYLNFRVIVDGTCNINALFLSTYDNEGR
jgi:hypothetical protein